MGAGHNASLGFDVYYKVNKSILNSSEKIDKSVIGQKPFRCTFVHAPATSYADTHFSGAQYAPLWAYTLAAYIPGQGRYSIEICDTRFVKAKKIREADIFLFSGLDQDCEMMLGVRKKLAERYPRSVSAVGGPICWSFDQSGQLERLRDFDYVCIGDGEEVIGSLLEDIRMGITPDHVIRAGRRYDFSRSRLPPLTMLQKNVKKYYGGMIEVSRGCPFLCEFCDVRVYPDNNRPHNKSPEQIVEEISRYTKLGISRLLLVCDNFIGDLRWAEEVVDKLIEFQKNSNARLSFFTESTMNLHKYPVLMKKLRLAGFDILHIGVESFSNDALLETAKVQNTKSSVVAVIRKIQSYGFIVVPGLIFGFDSDKDDCFELTLNGLSDSGLMAGDPGLLKAIPGTPLYHRMKLAGRLRTEQFGMGFRYQTNICYLQPTEFLISGMRKFFRLQSDRKYQYTRLKNFMDLIQGENYTALPGSGYVDMWRFAKIVMSDYVVLKNYLIRVGGFLCNLNNTVYATKGFILVSRNRHIKGRYGYMFFWLFSWTNMSQKYRKISDKHFDIESVSGVIHPQDILPDSYEESMTDAENEVPRVKILAQRRHSVKRLKLLIANMTLSEEQR